MGQQSTEQSVEMGRSTIESPSSTSTSIESSPEGIQQPTNYEVETTAATSVSPYSGTIDTHQANDQGSSGDLHPIVFPGSP